MDIYIGSFLTIGLIIAVVTDLKAQRIPNKLTFTIIVAAIAYHGLTKGVDGLGFSLAGLGLGLAVMILPYLLGVMGGGDVKLMAAIGACLGAPDTITAFLFTSLAGGLYAVAVLIFRPELFKRILKNIWTTLWILAASRKAEYAPAAKPEQLPRLCYGVAIATGTVAAMGYAAMNSGIIV